MVFAPGSVKPWTANYLQARHGRASWNDSWRLSMDWRERNYRKSWSLQPIKTYSGRNMSSPMFNCLIQLSVCPAGLMFEILQLEHLRFNAKEGFLETSSWFVLLWAFESAGVEPAWIFWRRLMMFDRSQIGLGSCHQGRFESELRVMPGRPSFSLGREATVLEWDEDLFQEP